LDGGPVDYRLVPEGNVVAAIAEAKAAVAAGAEMAPLLDAVKAERHKTFPATVRAMSPGQLEAFRSSLADLKAAA
jgi:hypothetical protein